MFYGRWPSLNLFLQLFLCKDTVFFVDAQIIIEKRQAFCERKSAFGGIYKVVCLISLFICRTCEQRKLLP